MEQEKQNGFKIPENYFEDFRRNIPELIKKEEQKRKSNQLTIFYAAAASLVLLMVSTFVFTSNNNELKNSTNSNYLLSDTEYYDLNINDIYFAYNDDTEINTDFNYSDDEIIDIISDEIDLDEFIFLSEDE